ncbi:hypothetical protein KKH23_06090 [Patescibacteria group bacterium]|nr:hypothetical protein [Patescibacteria group bacterium]
MAEDTNQKGAPPRIKQLGQKKVSMQEGELAQTKFRPSPYQPPCPVPPPAGAPQGVEPDHTELIQRILEQHETLKQILDKITELVTSIGTAPKPELNYYDTPQRVITVATPTQPNSPDIISNVITATPGYQAETIYATLQRIAPKITVINDGSDTLFIITSPEGMTWSSEATILSGEARTFWNVWEMRLRSPTAGILGTPNTGGVYRVTERDYWLAYVKLIPSGGGLSPIDKASLTNQAQPAANTDILFTLTAARLTPTNTPTTFRVMVAMSNAGTFSAVIYNGVIPAQVVNFNVVPGPALVANGLYTFDMLVHANDIVDFRYTVTGGTILVLRVQELDSASA